MLMNILATKQSWLNRVWVHCMINENIIELKLLTVINESMSYKMYQNSLACDCYVRKMLGITLSSSKESSQRTDLCEEGYYDGVLPQL
jgi:hypothetical protein